MNKLTFFLGVFFLIFSVGAVAQDQDVFISSDYDWYEQYKEILEDWADNCDPEDGVTDDIEQQACDNHKALLDAEVEKQIALSRHLVAAFHRQGVATNIILALVVLVVISGLALTAYQLRVAARSGGPQASSELEASAAKVRITSSSVGIVVLTISLIFLYLYVKEIYGISVIPLSG